MLPDDEQPRPFETRYRNRTRRIHTLFGKIQLQRNYHYHTKTHHGRCPLDDLLGLEDSHTPAVARLMCRASSRAGSYQEAADDLAAYAALQLDPRDLGRMVAAVAPGLREALAVLLRQEALRRGLDRAKKVVYLGDGAAWIWENCRLTFPGAVEILDFYHASEHVGQLATAIHDNDPMQASTCATRWCHDMKQTSPATLLVEVLGQLLDQQQTKSRRWTTDPIALPA